MFTLKNPITDLPREVFTLPEEGTLDETAVVNELLKIGECNFNFPKGDNDDDGDNNRDNKGIADQTGGNKKRGTSSKEPFRKRNWKLKSPSE